MTAIQAQKGEQEVKKDDAQPAGPVYEMRTYTTEPGRLDALNKRFRDHTLGLFEAHGMKNVMYWTPSDKPDTLVYVIAHKSRDAAKASWAAFVADPKWKKVATESQLDGKIVAKVESIFMTATDYSPNKVSFDTEKAPR